MPEDVAIASTKSEVDTCADDGDIDRPKSADRQTDGRTDGFSALYSRRSVQFLLMYKATVENYISVDSRRVFLQDRTFITQKRPA